MDNLDTKPSTSASQTKAIEGENTGLGSSEIPWAVFPQIRSAAFSDINNAWFVTYKEGELFRTDDGGRSWDELPVEGYDKSPKTRISQISFIDSQRGWATNLGGEVLRTTDGGRNWVVIAKLKTDEPDWEGITNLEQIKFTDESHGWIIETFTIWRTEDGGVNWSRVFSVSDPRVTGYPLRGSFLDGLNAWVCGAEGQVYDTNDGGKTWRVQTLSNTECRDVFFVDEHTGWLGSAAGGQLYRTDNGGKTWELQPRLDKKNIYFESIWFLGKEEGWGVARQMLEGSTSLMKRNVEQNLTRGVLLHTSDGGRTWRTVDIGSPEPFFNRVYFADAQHGWLLSRDNTYRTDDGGQSWQSVLKMPPIKSKSDSTTD